MAKWLRFATLRLWGLQEPASVSEFQGCKASECLFFLLAWSKIVWVGVLRRWPGGIVSFSHKLARKSTLAQGSVFHIHQQHLLCEAFSSLCPINCICAYMKHHGPRCKLLSWPSLCSAPLWGSVFSSSGKVPWRWEWCLIYIASYTVLCTQWIENAETDLLNCLVPSHSWAFWSNIIILLLFKFFSSRKYHMLQMLLSYIFALGWLDNSIKTWSLKGFLRFSKTMSLIKHFLG